MLGIAGYFIVKTLGSKDSSQSVAGSTGGGSFTYTSAPILDSFNSVVNSSSPTYLTYKNESVSYSAPPSESTKIADALFTKKESTTSIPLSQNSSMPLTTNVPTLFNQFIPASSSSIGGHSFTSSGKGTMMSTPSPMYATYVDSKKSASTTSTAVPVSASTTSSSSSTKKETSSGTSTFVKVASVVAPIPTAVVRSIGRLFRRR